MTNQDRPLSAQYWADLEVLRSQIGCSCDKPADPHGSSPNLEKSPMASFLPSIAFFVETYGPTAPFLSPSSTLLSKLTCLEKNIRLVSKTTRLQNEKMQKEAEVQKLMAENVRLNTLLDKKEAQLLALNEQCKFMALSKPGT